MKLKNPLYVPTLDWAAILAAMEADFAVNPQKAAYTEAELQTLLVGAGKPIPVTEARQLDAELFIPELAERLNTTVL